jgi:hypothetical protein
MIRMRLGGSNDPLEPFPQKPRGMHWRTYRRLRDQAHAAKAEADYLLAESIPRLGQFLHPVPPRRKRQRGRRDGGPKPPSERNLYLPAEQSAPARCRGTAGRLRALAVTGSTRLEALPKVPTVGEFLPGYEASDWHGVGAPKGTPLEIIGMLNREINAALTDPKIKGRFADFGATVLPGSPADFAKLIADETEKWGKVVQATHIKAD